MGFEDVGMRILDRGDSLDKGFGVGNVLMYWKM